MSVRAEPPAAVVTLAPRSDRAERVRARVAPLSNVGALGGMHVYMLLLLLLLLLGLV